MADIFKGKPVIKKNGKSFPANQTLYDKQFICLYFAVQWCPPCRMFTPVLANVYEDAKKDNLIIEVQEGPAFPTLELNHGSFKQHNKG
ncbi:nucleoredoxin-like [Dermacentor albipictus]|uniref:nucleoredoxin-like n=1 Tax=Dermacentor albipictus TaxID=60249 RepID=UPI0031FE11AE